MKYAVFLNNTDVQNEELAIYRVAESGALFAIDSSWIEQKFDDEEDIVVVEPFNNSKVTLIELDSNGFCQFSIEYYERKDNTPCFIAENSNDIESWQSIYNEVFNAVKTKEVMFAVLEKYSFDEFEPMKQLVENGYISVPIFYEKVTNETVESFVEGFMDSYFLGDPSEIYCSIATKLEDYIN